MNNSINISVFLLENSNKNLFKEYVYQLDKKIIDLKNTILEDLKKINKNNESNYIELDNITEREYKDFGKLSFSKGLLPFTFDNYKLSEFTIENRTFQFIAIPKNNIIHNTNQNYNKNYNSSQSGVLKKAIKGQFSNKIVNEPVNEFVFDNNDFPPLGK